MEALRLPDLEHLLDAECQALDTFQCGPLDSSTFQGVHGVDVVSDLCGEGIAVQEENVHERVGDYT